MSIVETTDDATMNMMQLKYVPARKQKDHEAIWF